MPGSLSKQNPFICACLALAVTLSGCFVKLRDSGSETTEAEPVPVAGVNIPLSFGNAHPRCAFQGTGTDFDIHCQTVINLGDAEYVPVKVDPALTVHWTDPVVLSGSPLSSTSCTESQGGTHFDCHVVLATPITTSLDFVLSLLAPNQARSEDTVVTLPFSAVSYGMSAQAPITYKQELVSLDLLSQLAPGKQLGFEKNGMDPLTTPFTMIDSACWMGDQLYFHSGFFVYRFDSKSNLVTVVAGSGRNAHDPNGQPLTTLPLDALALRSAFSNVLRLSCGKQLLLTDGVRHTILRLETDGRLTIVAGIPAATGGFSGDGGPATAAHISPSGRVLQAPDGSLYFADGGSKIRKVGADGIISTFIGKNGPGFAGDGGPAAEAKLTSVTDLAISSDGQKLWIADGSREVREVSFETLRIEKLVGPGPNGTAGSEDLSQPASLLYQEGKLYISQLIGALRIYRLDVATRGPLETFAISALVGPSQTNSSLILPLELSADKSGSILVADNFQPSLPISHVLRVSAAGPAVLIGSAPQSLVGREENVNAFNARFYTPRGLTVLPDGTLLVADNGELRVRAISPEGNVRTVAGGGAQPAEGQSDSGNNATDRYLPELMDVAADPAEAGAFFILQAHRLARVSASGAFTVIAGDLNLGSWNNNDGPAAQASFYAAFAVRPAPDGSLYVSDSGDISSSAGCIRKISPPPNRQIHTVAGICGLSDCIASSDPRCPAEFFTDGPGAQNRALRAPMGLALQPDGSLLFAEVASTTTLLNRGLIRRLDFPVAGPNAGSTVVTTIAGNSPISTPDPSDARTYRLNQTERLALGADGTIYVTQPIQNNDAVRILKPKGDGTYSTELMPGLGSNLDCGRGNFKAKVDVNAAASLATESLALFCMAHPTGITLQRNCRPDHTGTETLAIAQVYLEDFLPDRPTAFPNGNILRIDRAINCP